MIHGKQFLRAFIFLLVLAVAVNCVSDLFGVELSGNAKLWGGLKREKRNSMDAVILGASNVTCFWQPLFGWADHGITVWGATFSGLTGAAIKNMIIEARKTQPNALYIINLSTFKGGVVLDNSHIHHVVDYMPFSLNKVSMTNDLIKRSKFKGMETLEYYLPIIRFHSRWNDLKPWVFGNLGTDTKMSYIAANFCGRVYDITDELSLNSTSRKKLSEKTDEVFTELLDYLEAEHVNALFLKSPQVVDKTQHGHMNVMEDMVAQRGYPCLDLLDDFYSVGFDTRTDFFNKGHTNIHGSLKFSKALGDYLVENYHFEDKRGLPGWEDWDRACLEYTTYIGAYTLPFEREHAPRFTSDIPALAKPSVDGKRITVTWTGVEGAEGYAIYRKDLNSDKGKTWRCVAEADAGTDQYTDKKLNASTEYFYTVVPLRGEEEAREYGSFDVLGVSAVTGRK